MPTRVPAAVPFGRAVAVSDRAVADAAAAASRSSASFASCVLLVLVLVLVVVVQTMVVGPSAECRTLAAEAVHAVGSRAPLREDAFTWGETGGSAA